MATSPVLIKQHDTWPPLDMTIKDKMGVAIDLTTASGVKLLAETPAGTGSWEGNCTVTGAMGGQVRYQWTGETDTATVNSYNAELQITWSDGNITTAPTDGYFTIQVEADLGN